MPPTSRELPNPAWCWASLAISVQERRNTRRALPAVWELPNFLGALVSVLILPVGLSLTELSARLLKYLGSEPAIQQPVQMMKQASSTLQLVVHGLAAVIFAPVIEEIIFRGVLYPTVKRYFSPKIALWGISLLFALSHQNLIVMLPLTVLAIFLTFLYETTRNLFAPILAHSLFNAANFVLLLLQR